MHPNEKINVNDWYMKRDPITWKAADFDCMNIPVDENQFDSKKVVGNQKSWSRL